MSSRVSGPLSEKQGWEEVLGYADDGQHEDDFELPPYERQLNVPNTPQRVRAIDGSSVKGICGDGLQAGIDTNI